MLRIYAYKGCGTCRQAIKWLVEHGIAFEELPIRDSPPSADEIRHALQAGFSLKQLFNSSGGDYRDLGLKDQLPAMGVDDAIELLTSRGNLVKRPFVLTGATVLVGFQVERWREVLLSEA